MKTSIVCWTTAALAFGGAAMAGEEGTVKAFAAWHAQGIMVQTGEKQATFVGALVGRMYVDTDKGPVESGSLVCPAALEVGSTALHILPPPRFHPESVRADHPRGGDA